MLSLLYHDHLTLWFLALMFFMSSRLNPRKFLGHDSVSYVPLIFFFRNCPYMLVFDESNTSRSACLHTPFLFARSLLTFTLSVKKMTAPITKTTVLVLWFLTYPKLKFALIKKIQRHLSIHNLFFHLLNWYLLWGRRHRSIRRYTLSTCLR